jgi:RNA polymerase sigma-70 factor (ECF subfamily)
MLRGYSLVDEKLSGPHDEALLRRAREGDESAFQELYERHAARLKARIARRLRGGLRRKVDESDVLQDAYVVALRRLATFEDRGEGSFGAWLAQIVENRVRETVRHYDEADKRALDREVTRGARPRSGEFRGRVTSPSQRMMGREMQARIDAALARMPPDYREVLRLLQLQQQSLDETARRMNRSVAAVQKLYERALARLAGELEL